MEGWERRLLSSIPLMSIHPCLPVLLSHKGGIVLGVKALDDSHSKGVRFGTVLMKSGVCVLDLSFLLKKEKII